MPERLLKKHLVFSRLEDAPKEYVQDRMLKEKDYIADMLGDAKTHIYVCGLRGMEEGVDGALSTIAQGRGLNWSAARDRMREEGRYHVETY